MSWIIRVDSRTEDTIDINKITTLRGYHRPKHLNLKNEYFTEISISARSDNAQLGIIYKISYTAGKFCISKENSFNGTYEKDKRDFEVKTEKKVQVKIYKILDEIQNIIDNVKKDINSITIDLNEEKYRLSDFLKNSNSK
jgi:hypothetical protein